MAWSNFSTVSLKQPLWYMNHRIHGPQHYLLYYWAHVLPLKSYWVGQPPKSFTSDTQTTGEFSHKYIVDAHTDLDNYSDKLRIATSRLRLCPLRNSPQNNIFQYKEIDTCAHVFLRQIAIAPPLTALYDGPYKVIVKSGRVVKIRIKGKVETVFLARVKPAHLDNEPETGTEKQRKTAK